MRSFASRDYIDEYNVYISSFEPIKLKVLQLATMRIIIEKLIYSFNFLYIKIDLGLNIMI